MLEIKKVKELFKQVIKFGLVGGIAFVIDYGILFIATEVIGIYYLLSSCISFVISLVFNYRASILWVFHVNEEKSKANVFSLFVIFSIVGLLINQLIMWVGVEHLYLHYLFVKIIATAIVMVFNFITRKLFIE